MLTRPLNSQDQDELEVFRSFVRSSGLPIFADSIVKRPIPEPDIFCRLLTGQELTFELVEICHPENSRFIGRCKRLGVVLEETYTRLPIELKDRIDGRFRGRPLSFCFRTEATLGKIRTILVRAFEEIAACPARSDHFMSFSPKVSKHLAYVRMVGRVEDPDRPSFNIAGAFNPGEMLLQTIEKKIRKRYKTAYPVELLAYFGHFAWPYSKNWKNRLAEALHVSGLAQFQRLWVLGWEGVEFTYPTDTSDAPKASLAHEL